MINYRDECFLLVNQNKRIFNNLEIYVKLILEYNKNMNLTGFDEEKIWEEGIYNSIVALKNQILDYRHKKMLDIGAGAGFPSVPFLIASDNYFELEIAEPIQKRILFLKIVKEKLNLNMKLINKRVEELSEENYYDIVCSRAVASLKILIEISIRVGKKDSLYIFLKGPKIKKEIENAQKIINEINLKYDVIKIKEIIEKDEYIFIYKKIFDVPNKYPRKWAIIKKENI
ncbi:MAG: 16S rRNA (guanine(527)-N(7))-methyltransferase RsmG [Metamycoplasmataceae bacterium]